MIVGCYTLDLYCDDPFAQRYNCTARPGQFTGQTRQECINKAKDAGWIVTKTTVLCPKHEHQRRNDG